MGLKYPPRSTEICGPKETPRPVFGVDIDGTLGVYHSHFIRFAEGYLGKTISHDYDGSCSLAKWCGVSKVTYRKVKLAYRRGGLKRSMPVYEGAADLTRTLRKRGAVVVICTTRPYLQLDNIEPDTTEFLRRNGIQYDGMISGEHKYRDLVRMFGAGRIVSIVEDIPELVRQAWESGIDNPLLIRRTHNVNFGGRFPQEMWPEAESLSETLAKFEVMLDKWEDGRREAQGRN